MKTAFTGIETVLIGIAAKTGAGLVKRILERTLGDRAGGLAGKVVDAVAEKLGAPPEQIPDLPEKQVEAAVREVEAQAPEMIALWSQGLDGQFALLQAEQQESWFGWAWRPAWMWLLGLLWLCRLLFVPVADGVLGTAIAGEIDIAVMLTLTGYFLALYMGGHTLKDLGSKAIDAWKARP